MVIMFDARRSWYGCDLAMCDMKWEMGNGNYQSMAKHPYTKENPDQMTILEASL